jgi:hypothetical protein
MQSLPLHQVDGIVNPMQGPLYLQGKATGTHSVGGQVGWLVPKIHFTNFGEEAQTD